MSRLYSTLAASVVNSTAHVIKEGLTCQKHTHTHTHTHTDIQTNTHTDTHTRTDKETHTDTHAYKDTHVQI